MKEGKGRIGEGKLKTDGRSIFSVIHHKRALPRALWFWGCYTVALDISLMFSFHSNTRVLEHRKSEEHLRCLTDTKVLDFSCPSAGTHSYSCWHTKLYFQISLLPLLLLWQHTVAKCEDSNVKASHVTGSILALSPNLHQGLTVH